MQFRKHALRFSIIFLGSIVLLCILATRLIFIQFFRSSHLVKLAEKQHKYLVEIEPVRGAIYDRKLRPLAFNVAVYSAYANPRKMSDKDKARALELLPNILDVSSSYIEDRLDRDKFFVWIKRKISIKLTEEIKEMKIRGIGFKKESKRFYPNEHLASHIIGFAGMDNTGLEGLELKYDRILSGDSGRMRVLKDARNRFLMIEDEVILPKDGASLVLTIDETVQYITEKALEEVFNKYQAKSATAIVMNVRTGEVLALANHPTYNLVEVGLSDVENRTNRAISFVYEPGSIFKIVAAVAALEENLFTEEDIIFCEEGQYRIANHTLHDHKPNGHLSFNDVFRLSSNIGVVKIVQEMGERVYYKYAQKFPFGKKTGIDLNGEVRGTLKPPKLWSRTTIGAIPIGHEVTTTSLQLVTSIAAIANGGVLMKPYIVKLIKDNQDNVLHSFSPHVVDRIMSEDTANRVKDILVSVVDEGTGHYAKIDGIQVAGKTGTAQKVVDGKYSHSNFVSSFFGFAPADNPWLACIVMIDDPKSAYYGGVVAGPVFKEIIEDTLKYLMREGI